MIEEYDPEWYEEHYFTRYPYRPYYTPGEGIPIGDGRFKVLKDVLNPKSVLDVGCAYGLMVRLCLENGIPAMGTDVSRWCEKQAETIIPGHFVRGNAWDLPFKDKEFDVIYCTGVLEHIPENLIDKTFSEFIRVADRYFIDVSFDCAGTAHHLCNHDFDWWFDKCPPNTWLSRIPNLIEAGDLAFKGEE